MARLFYSDIDPNTKKKWTNRHVARVYRFMKLKKEFFQDELERTPFNLAEVVEEVWKKHFQDIKEKPEIMFCRDISLAHVTLNRKPVRIHISSLLNTPRTPRQVIEHIIIHEFLHLRIKPREIEGKMKSPPP